MEALRRHGIGPADVALCAVLSGFALLMGLGEGDHGAFGVLNVATTLPVLWRRAAPLAASAGIAAGCVVSALPYLDAPRCGAAIPAALLVVYEVGVRLDRRTAVQGLALVLAGMVAMCCTDSIAGPEALLFVLPVCAGVWAAGLLVAARNRLAAELAERSRELVRRRGETARLAVEVERVRLTAQLDRAARRRVEAMVALADAGAAGVAAGTDDPVATFARLEEEGRASLNAMRDLLGRLRSDTWAERAPLPTLDGLDGLVDTARADGRTVALDVEGPRRPLVGGVELAAYRLVQHALAAAGRGAVRVRLRYRADALDLEVGADAGVAPEPLAVVRERVRAHGGRLTVETSEPGGTLLRAELPAARA